MQTINSKELNQNPILVEVPIPDTELKNWIVQYVGNKHITNDENVTVEMIIDIVAEEFPEFLMAVAEENFFRGYEQALVDLQESNNLEQERDK